MRVVRFIGILKHGVQHGERSRLVATILLEQICVKRHGDLQLLDRS